MKNINFLVIIIAMLATSAFAEKNGTEGHGGQTFTEQGVEYLKDLKESNSCEVLTSFGFIQDNISDYSELEKYLTQVHPDLQLAFSNQAVLTTVCYTAKKLISVDTQDHQSLMIDKDIQGNQIAIRFENTIYINKSLFKKMAPTHRKYLLVHEFMHGLMGEGEIHMRYHRLQAFVYNLQKLIETSNIREDRLATILAYSEAKGVPLFSSEKTCGINAPSVFSLEDAKRDCEKLYGPYSRVNSITPNVIYGMGEAKYTKGYTLDSERKSGKAGKRFESTTVTLYGADDGRVTGTWFVHIIAQRVLVPFGFTVYGETFEDHGDGDWQWDRAHDTLSLNDYFEQKKKSTTTEIKVQ